MTPTRDDRLAELAARHYLGEYTGLVARRLDALLGVPGGAENADSLRIACEHLGVTGEAVEEVVARLPGGTA
ncbi:MAG: hypothetical protein U5K81_04200 [Trueperaceae bacterium]|nr:hypothetical protein [Trueperaceae bacterium]